MTAGAVLVKNGLDICDSIGKIEEAGPFKLVPTCSTTAMIVVGDILSILTMEKKKSSDEDTTGDTFTYSKAWMMSQAVQNFL